MACMSLCLVFLARTLLHAKQEGVGQKMLVTTSISDVIGSSSVTGSSAGRSAPGTLGSGAAGDTTAGSPPGSSNGAGGSSSVGSGGALPGADVAGRARSPLQSLFANTFGAPAHDHHYGELPPIGRSKLSQVSGGQGSGLSIEPQVS